MDGRTKRCCGGRLLLLPQNVPTAVATIRVDNNLVARHNKRIAYVIMGIRCELNEKTTASGLGCWLVEKVMLATNRLDSPLKSCRGRQLSLLLLPKHVRQITVVLNN